MTSVQHPPAGRISYTLSSCHLSENPVWFTEVNRKRIQILAYKGQSKRKKIVLTFKAVPFGRSFSFSFSPPGD